MYFPDITRSQSPSQTVSTGMIARIAILRIIYYVFSRYHEAQSSSQTVSSGMIAVIAIVSIICCVFSRYHEAQSPSQTVPFGMIAMIAILSIICCVFSRYHEVPVSLTNSFHWYDCSDCHSQYNMLCIFQISRGPSLLHKQFPLV